MGKKIDYDKALSAAAIQVNDSIYAKPNSYGYKININHPDIKPMYEMYKHRIGAKILSDAQRHHFESIIFEMLEKNQKR